MNLSLPPFLHWERQETNNIIFVKRAKIIHNFLNNPLALRYCFEQRKNIILDWKNMDLNPLFDNFFWLEIENVTDLLNKKGIPIDHFERLFKDYFEADYTTFKINIHRNWFNIKEVTDFILNNKLDSESLDAKKIEKIDNFLKSKYKNIHENQFKLIKEDFMYILNFYVTFKDIVDYDNKPETSQNSKIDFLALIKKISAELKHII